MTAGRAVLLGCVMTAGLLAAAEGGARLYAHATQTVLFPAWAVFDDELGYRLQPGAAVAAQDVRINRLGFRGEEVRQPIGRPLVVFVGDSCVYGDAASSEQATLPAQVAAALEERGRQVQSLNAGVSGYTSAQAARVFANRIVPLRPALAVLYVGWNDIDFAPGLMGPHHSAVVRWLSSVSARLETCSYAYSWLVWVARDTAGPDHLMYANHAPTTAMKERVVAQYQANLQRIVATARAHHVTLCLVTRPTPLHEGLTTSQVELLLPWRPLKGHWLTFLEWHAALNGIVRDAGQSQEVAVIDLERDLERLPEAQRLRLFADAEHPNDEGYRAIAQLMVEPLLSLLDERRASLR
ncbi:MAG: SGNH/GDSL hydrolase family protein [Candidatus Omnitrophica bacterium]|nr:SGNH/GDSL hydrolase family protein [Candidatus Omnitrophota bacterium]